jgi:uncharacterized protein (DUF1697 family)
MSRNIAFLRAINVSGRNVKMDALRQIFESIGLTGVETFIASGNVIFDSSSEDTSLLESRIEQKLRETLGFDVATFIRGGAELAAIVKYQPFSPSQQELAAAFNIAFIKNPVDEQASQKLMALQNEIDAFHIHGREVYWLCRVKQSESTFSNAVLEKTLKVSATMRGANTIRKMAEKYG